MTILKMNSRTSVPADSCATSPSRPRTLPALPTHVRRETLSAWRLFWRTPAAGIYALGIPLFFLVLLAVLGGGSVGGVPAIQRTVPSVIVFSFVSACLMNLLITTVTHREDGVLVRLRLTPVPPAAYVVSRVAVAVAAAVCSSAVLLVVGVSALGFRIAGLPLLGMLGTLMIAATALCGLGLAASSLAPSREAAVPLASVIGLPLIFLSGAIFSLDGLPRWLSLLLDLSPVTALTTVLRTAADPTTTAAVPYPGALAVLVVWAVLAPVLAALTFRWSPRATR